MKKTKTNYELNFLRNAEVVKMVDGYGVYSVVADKQIFVTHFKKHNDALQAIRLATKILKAVDKENEIYEQD